MIFWTNESLPAHPLFYTLGLELLVLELPGEIIKWNHWNEHEWSNGSYKQSEYDWDKIMIMVIIEMSMSEVTEVTRSQNMSISQQSLVANTCKFTTNFYERWICGW